MSPDTGDPLDTLASETIKWAKGLGSTSTTLSEVLSKKDSVVSLIKS